MKPGLLPLMLLLDSYEVSSFVSPTFPVGLSLSGVGVASKSLSAVGVVSCLQSSVDVLDSSMEVPT
jgi:hypothetical protein